MTEMGLEEKKVTEKNEAILCHVMFEMNTAQIFILHFHYSSFLDVKLLDRRRERRKGND